MSLKQSLIAPHEPRLFEHTVVVRHRLEEQYRDLEHQSHAAISGMWVFLATEALLFGSLFVAVGVYWIQYREAVEAVSVKLNWKIGGLNTLVLLLSSFTMALAVHSARTANSRRVAWLLVATGLIGGVFLALKGLEYAIDFEEDLVPGPRFRPDEWLTKEHLAQDQLGPVQVFLLLYWTMTIIHAVHLTIGIALVLIMAILAHRGRFSPEYHAPVEITGLYWHFVDLVWLFLFPSLYLLGTHHL